AGEPAPVGRVGGVLVADHLDRDEAPGGGAAEVDHPHSARAEPGEQRVVAEGRGVVTGQGFQSGCPFLRCGGQGRVQTSTFPFSCASATRVPSEFQAMSWTGSSQVPTSGRRSPADRSQTSGPPSRAPETRISPFGLIARAVTGAGWPVPERTSSWVSASNTRTVRSSPPVAISRPSGL